MEHLGYWEHYSEMALRLILALLAGTILGLNRWLHHKSAGMRTHSLVAIGSATAVMSLGNHGVIDTQALSHVFQGLITGLGFLGAGVIIREHSSQRIHGLTTAASIWSSALIAAAFGAGQLVLGGLALGAIVLTLVLGGPLERMIRKLTGIRRASELSTDPDE
jgi:putative Mg2+ transporter-C (MgtC) family protein